MLKNRTFVIRESVGEDPFFFSFLFFSCGYRVEQPLKGSFPVRLSNVKFFQRKRRRDLPNVIALAVSFAVPHETGAFLVQKLLTLGTL